MRILGLILIFCSLLTPLLGQQSMDHLTTPNSPAASALGIQPSAILTPKTADLLELGVYAGLANGTSTSGLPADLAFELTPYWTKDHGLKFEEYLFPKKPFISQLQRNSSFSFATTQSFKLGDSTTSSGIGFGYRCTFFFGGEDDRKKITVFRENARKNREFITSIKSDSKDVSDTTNSTNRFLAVMNPILIKEYMINLDISKEDAEKRVSALVDMCRDSLPEFPKGKKGEKDKDAKKGFDTKFIDLIDKEIDSYEVLNQFSDYLDNRVGFSLDIAYASFLNFPQNDFQQSYLPKQSIWITPGYQGSGFFQKVHFSGVLRYEWYNRTYFETWFPNSNFYTHNFDYGLALSMNGKKFFFQLELVGRSSTNNKQIGTSLEGNPIFEQVLASDVQYMGTFNYQITETIIVSYTLGNRFDPILNPENTLVSMLSLNFGFGKQGKDILK